MAVIIGRSNRSVSEKHSAYKQLITEYDDMPTPKNMHYKSYDSLHKKLSEFIDYEERIITHFKAPEADTFYMYEVYRNKYDNHRRSDSVFTDFDKVIADIKDSWEHYEVSRIKIEKIYMDGTGSICIGSDYYDNIYWIEGHDPELVDVDKMIKFSEGLFYVDIPVPFKRGDILTTAGDSREKDIFVLDSLVFDEMERLERSIRNCMNDGTDLVAWGYFVDDDGVLYGDHSLCHNSFEYYQGELEGKDRLLHYVNLYINDKIRLPELLAMQCRIMLEHKLENGLSVHNHGRYISPEQILS
jgi:hypothetical protein